MKYYIPRLRLGVLEPSQKSFCDKIGGLPWGLSKKYWPICGECKRPLTFNAQFAHNRERLNLGAPTRALFLFSCAEPSICESWDAKGRANAAFVLNSEKMTDGLTSPPSVSTTVEPEAIVVGWREPTENVGPKLYSKLWRRSTAETVTHKLYPRSKLGGAPFWIQPSVLKLPSPRGRFLLQLGNAHEFEGPPPKPAEVGCEFLYYSKDKEAVRRVVPRGFNQLSYPYWRRGQPGTNGRPSQIVVNSDGTWNCETAGFPGMAYVFMLRDASCYMFMQN
jgi:hypothetical protein